MGNVGSMQGLIRADIAHSDEETCMHPGCRAYKKLLAYGAKLHRTHKGHVAARRCEISMLAAAGPSGLSDPDLVWARRHFAHHLGDPFPGADHAPIADNDFAVHADHAAQGPDVKQPVVLGPRIRVTKTNGILDVWRKTDHYVLTYLP